MEEQTTATSPLHTNHRESPSRRADDDDHAERASTPTPPAEHQTPLSSSEPTLRFPRPVGNRYLANWISTSDPDIMRLTTTAEDSGLSESTYELITGTDNESQDGNYTESMGESISSLDNHQADDTYSFVGTEQTYEDESAADDFEVQQLESDVGEEPQNDTLVGQTEEIAVESESDDGGSSRCSIEYAHQSLSNPSISTPEASKIIDKLPRRKESSQFSDQLQDGLDCLREAKDMVIEVIMDTASGAYPGVMPGITIVLLLCFGWPLLSKISTDFSSHFTPPVGPVPSLDPSASSTISTSQTGLATSSVALVPREDHLSDDWLFGQNKPVVSFTPRPNGDVLIEMSEDVMKAWLSKGCLTVTATRDDHHIDTIMSPVDDGVLLKFAQRDAHGVVDLSLKSTCRPKLQKMVKVHFGKGIMGEASEFANRWALKLNEYIPVVAQVTERYFEEAKRSVSSWWSDAVAGNLPLVSEDAMKGFRAALTNLTRSLKPVRAQLWQKTQKAREDLFRVFENLPRPSNRQVAQKLLHLRDLQARVQLVVLDAQVAANVWWLKFTGQEQEYADYQRKAQSYIANIKTVAAVASRQRHARVKASVDNEAGSWTWRSWPVGQRKGQDT